MKNLLEGRVAITKQSLFDVTHVAGSGVTHTPLGSLFVVFFFDYLTQLTGTIGGLFSQILNGEEVSRESAINFLSSVVEEYGKAVLHPSQETEEFLVEEIKKVIKTNVKVYQRNHSIEDKCLP